MTCQPSEGLGTEAAPPGLHCLQREAGVLSPQTRCQLKAFCIAPGSEGESGRCNQDAEALEILGYFDDS